MAGFKRRDSRHRLRCEKKKERRHRHNRRPHPYDVASRASTGIRVEPCLSNLPRPVAYLIIENFIILASLKYDCKIHTFTIRLPIRKVVKHFAVYEL